MNHPETNLTIHGKWVREQAREASRSPVAPGIAAQRPRAARGLVRLVRRLRAAVVAQPAAPVCCTG